MLVCISLSAFGNAGLAADETKAPSNEHGWGVRFQHWTSVNSEVFADVPLHAFVCKALDRPARLIEAGRFESAAKCLEEKRSRTAFPAEKDYLCGLCAQGRNQYRLAAEAFARVQEETSDQDLRQKAIQAQRRCLDALSADRGELFFPETSLYPAMF